MRRIFKFVYQLSSLLEAKVPQSERLDLYKSYATRLLEVCSAVLLLTTATYRPELWYL
jgi:hypothetical protein